MNTSTDLQVQHVHSYQRLRPWTQEQADRLSPEEKSALDWLEQDAHHTSDTAASVIQRGLKLNLLARHKTYRKLGLKNMEEVCKAFHNIGAQMGRIYQGLARSFKLDLVRGTIHGPTHLLAIRKADKKYWPALLELGSGQTVAAIEAAIRKAEACATLEEGLKAIAAALTEDQTVPQGKPSPLRAQLKAIASAVQRTSRSTRRTAELLDQGHELPPDWQRQLKQNLEGSIADQIELLRRLDALKPPPPSPIR